MNGPINARQLNLCKFYDDTYLTLGTESDWVDIVTMKEAGTLVAFMLMSNNWTSANYLNQLQVVDANENILRTFYQRVDGSNPVPNRGPEWYYCNIRVQAGSTIRGYLISGTAGARYQVHAYVLPPELRPDGDEALSVFGSATEPGDHTLVLHSQLSTVLRRLQAELEELDP